VLTERPTQPENRGRQHRLRGQLSQRQIGGRLFDQWQYEVTAAGGSGTAPIRTGGSSGSLLPVRLIRR
jgi:hypothetical protein